VSYQRRNVENLFHLLQHRSPCIVLIVVVVGHRQVLALNLHKKFLQPIRCCNSMQLNGLWGFRTSNSCGPQRTYRKWSPSIRSIVGAKEQAPAAFELAAPAYCVLSWWQHSSSMPILQNLLWLAALDIFVIFHVNRRSSAILII